MARLPSLEYSLSHPHPNGRVFLLVTLVIFLLTLPALILVNFVTQGSELVPSLQSHYQPNDTLLEGWWGTRRLPSLLRPKVPQCQPKDIGRGDTFRLTTSLFDYTVMGTLSESEHTGNPKIPKQIRAEYRGENFTNCHVNRARFEYSLFEQTQSLMLGLLCPNFPKPTVNVSMQTTITFAVELSKDFIGQYYGPGLTVDLLETNDTDPNDYRKVVLAVLELISNDSIVVMRRNHLSSPAGSMRIVFKVDPDTVAAKSLASTITYANGTQPLNFTEEAKIFGPAIENLLAVAIDAVHLDLGRRGRKNIFMNATLFNRIIKPNLAPSGIDPRDWALGFQSFHYGLITEPYQTWAQMLLAGQPVKVGDLTELPDEPAMATTYLCPTYRVKPTSSLLSSVFIGSATMTLSVWGVWMFFTAFLAKRIMAPKVPCECKDCVKRRQEEEEEEKNRLTSQPTGRMLSRLFRIRLKKPTATHQDEEVADSDSGSGSGSRFGLDSSFKISELEFPPAMHMDVKHLSQTSTYTIEEKQNLGAV